jgi:LAS superfamily LD-carboxypeptidase LdcB
MNNLKNILTGKTQDHLLEVSDNSFLHRECVDDFKSLSKRCDENGFDLKIVSSFRSFEKQLQIWNNKALGLRDILDDNGNILDPKDLSKKELVLAIMRWSAMPGMSRHHWGSDFDIVDGNKLKNNYQVQLTPEETSKNGVFEEIHLFLDDLISNKESFNFYRPYEKDLGGVAPEKWHLSYAPISSEYIKILNFEFFENFLNEQNPKEFLLLETILENKKEIYDRFIINLSPQ